MQTVGERYTASIATATNGGDPGINFRILQRSARWGRDYVIMHRMGPSGLLVMAPHGGGIEPGTDDIADAVAGRQHAFYSFRGTKRQGNHTLHLTSDRFDEPLALTMAAKADWVLAIHGCRDVEPVVWVGGRDRHRADRIIHVLQVNAIPAQRCRRPGLQGLHPGNICNRGSSGAGVQLELSAGLRQMLFRAPHRQSARRRAPLFHQLVDCLRRCLQVEETGPKEELEKPLLSKKEPPSYED